MTKIAHIFSDDLWAGAEVAIYNLLKGLSAYNNLQLTAISLNEGKLSQKLRDLKVETFVIKESKSNFLSIFFKTLSILRGRGVDVIHVHRYKENILAFLLSFCLGNPILISTVHGFTETPTKKPSLKWRFLSGVNYGILQRYFSKVVSVSKDIRGGLVSKYGFSDSRLAVIHNGIDPPSLKSARPKNNILIGSAGRLFPVKDYALMIEIANYICKVRKNVTFKIAGDGPQRDILEEQITTKGLEKCFTLQGFTENMKGFYHSLDIYLNSSVHEGIPLTVLEAMAHGIPVVAPKVGGLPEIINDDVEGFLIGSRKAEDFGKKCLELTDNSRLRLKMGQAARMKVVENFSNKNMAEKYYRIYNQLSERKYAVNQ